jgi:thiol-disulfide isomerase/thioredoxin
MAIEIGDPAPPLQVKEWVKGGPIDMKDGRGKNVYVIEFWATWCGPCRTSIPHLTKLQKKYEKDGLVIVGISSDDRNLEVVQNFVKDRGDDMDYAVAYEEDEKGKTNAAYMVAFKQRGIPTAFIIDKEGRIAWLGHPMSMDPVLEAVLADKWDLAKARKDYAEQQKREENRTKALPLLEKYVEAACSPDGEKVCRELAEQFVPLIDKDSMVLNSISWEILTNEDFRYRDLKLALKLAKLADELTESKHPAIIDTYARALWDTGDKQAAIELQKKAIELVADNPEMKAALEKTLKEYEDKLK